MRPHHQTIISDRLAQWILAFCALVPTSWDRPVWALLLVLILMLIIARRHLLAELVVPLTVLAFVGWQAGSVLWSVEPVKTATEVVIGMIMVLLGLLLAVGRSLRDLLRVTARSAVLLLLICWVVAIVVPSIGISSEPGRIGEMQGLFISKNTFGNYCVLALLTVVLHAAAQPVRRRTGPLLGVLLATASMLASGSRTALVVSLLLVGFGLVLRALSRARRPLAVPVSGWLLTLGAVAFVVVSNWTTILLALGRDPTLTGRTRIWSVVWGAVQERPVLGFGWKALWLDGSPTTLRLWAGNYDVPFYHAHNGYLDMAAQLGLVGLLLAVLLVGSVGAASARRYLADPSAAAIWPLLLVLLVIIDNATEVTGFTNITWLLLVCLASQHSGGMPSLKERRTACISVTRPDCLPVG